MNGLYDAKMDQVPVLAITGLQYSDLLGQDYQQDVDTDKLMMDVAAYTERVMQPGHVQSVTNRAARFALSTPGVRHIAFPLDVQDRLHPMEQMMYLGNPEYGVELQNVDFVKLAEAFGLKSFHVEHPDDADDVMARFLATPGPALLEAVVDPYEPFLPGHIKPQLVKKVAGGMQVGMGMANATYPVHRSAAGTRASLRANGDAVVASGTQDLRTGTYTVMTQLAANALGLPPERVHFALGDTALPHAPTFGGSSTVNTVGPAVRAACWAIQERAITLACNDPASPSTAAIRPRLQWKTDACWLGTTEGGRRPTRICSPGGASISWRRYVRSNRGMSGSASGCTPGAPTLPRST